MGTGIGNQWSPIRQQDFISGIDVDSDGNVYLAIGRSVWKFSAKYVSRVSYSYTNSGTLLHNTPSTAYTLSDVTVYNGTVYAGGEAGVIQFDAQTLQASQLCFLLLT
jgi:hypothetical protein